MASSSRALVASAMLLALGVGCGPSLLTLGQRRDPKANGLVKAHDVIQLAAGERHTCALSDAGEVYCWGSNAYGQLGETKGARLSWSPKRIEGVEGAVQIAAASGLTCARLRDGTARCWGRAKKGFAFSAATPLEGAVDVAEIAVGFDLVCVRKNDGAVLCRKPIADDTFRPIANVVGAQQLVVGFSHACALLADGGVRCWGSNTAGELGDGTLEPRFEGVRVIGLEHAVQLHASRRRSCAWLRDGSVHCWGNLVLEPRAKEPVEISAAHGIAGFAATTSQACAWSSEGRIECVESGNGMPRRTTLSGIREVVQLVAGSAHFCSLGGAGDVHCWGHDDDGQLGDPATASATPREVPGLSDAVAIDLSPGRGCVVRRSGRVTCWGHVERGTDDARIERPFDLSDFGDAVSVESDGELGCALRRGGLVSCFQIDRPGMNLGLEGLGLRLLTQVVQVGVGSGFACARLEDGSVWCSGQNYSGQLGDGTTSARPTPARVAGVDAALELAVAGSRACARSRDGSVRCWGSESALDRSPPTADVSREVRRMALLTTPSDAESVYPSEFSLDSFWRQVPVGVSPSAARLPGSKPWTALSTGEGRICAIGDRTPWCWPDVTSEPRAVDGAGGAVELAVARTHACALIDDGSVRCWGDNDYGQLGAGATSAPRESAAPVLGLADVLHIAAAEDTSCAVLKSGTVKCWGSNDRGQLGDGIDHGERKIPLRVPRWLAN